MKELLDRASGNSIYPRWAEGWRKAADAGRAQDHSLKFVESLRVKRINSEWRALMSRSPSSYIDNI
jgi:hypothetical protein